MGDFLKEIQRIEETDILYIYGAGDVAREVAYCLMGPPYHKKIEAFIVSDNSHADGDIYGSPIKSIDAIDISKNTLILICVLEKYKEEIVAGLYDREVKNILSCTFESDLWSSIRKKGFEEYVKRNGWTSLLYLPSIAMKSEKKEIYLDEAFKVFVAKSHMDKRLKNDIPRKEWETDIQVGAALTEQRIADLSDDLGDNISYKNRCYCELTALYWIWKNGSGSYAGLSHYRRRFNLDKNDIRRIIDEDLDVIVTVPILNVPNVKFMYEKNHLAVDWRRMEEAIKELYPNYIKELYFTAEGKFYFGYNMLIMKKKILDDYCKWLFSILEYCEDSSLERDTYQSRYNGFLGERLLTVYLLHHIEEYKIAYADKCFYE